MVFFKIGLGIGTDGRAVDRVANQVRYDRAEAQGMVTWNPSRAWVAAQAWTASQAWGAIANI